MGMKFADPLGLASNITTPSPLHVHRFTSNNAIAGAVLVSNYTLIPDGNIGEGQTNKKNLSSNPSKRKKETESKQDD